MTVDNVAVRLTAHPLQRVGAYALAALSGVSDARPERMGHDEFRSAVDSMTDHSVRAALVSDTKQPDGFWLKCSLAFFPNSKMNHHSRLKNSPADIEADVRAWRRMPEESTWPDAPCALCGYAAVGFYGKLDIVLMESDLYRNNTPRGHEGLALCWPCVCSFHALPYGCRQTGGRASAVHSWDEAFLVRTVARQVDQNRRTAVTGVAVKPPSSIGVIALRALRGYAERVTAGVEVLSFTNDNRGQELRIDAMDQPMAEWLRTTTRNPDRRSAFAALLRAHQREGEPGIDVLARHAFQSNGAREIVKSTSNFLAARCEAGGMIAETPAVAELCFSLTEEVVGMHEKDLAEIRQTGKRIALLFGKDDSAGRFKEFYSAFKDTKRFRIWLNRRSVDFLLASAGEAPEPLLSTRALELLFSPESEGPSWFYRQLLLTSVIEELHSRGWAPKDAKAIVDELGDDDRDYLNDEEQA